MATSIGKPGRMKSLEKKWKKPHIINEPNSVNLGQIAIWEVWVRIRFGLGLGLVLELDYGMVW